MKKLLIALLLMLVATPVFAAPAVTAQGAEALKKLAKASLAHQEAAFKSSGMTLLQQGDVVVEEAGTYYALTTPMLSLQMPGGITRTIGMVAINAIPTDNPDVYKMAVALPTPILDTRDGQTVGSVNIGTQSMNGLYDFRVQNFTELNGTYKDVAISRADGSTMTIPEISTQTTLSDQGQGLWSGPSQTTITGMAAKDKTGEYSADKIQVNAKLDGIDLLSTNLFRAKMQQAMQSGNAEGKITGLITDYLSSFANGIDLMVSSSGIKFKQFLAGKTSSGTVASSSLTAALKNIKSDMADISLNSATNGLAFDDPNSVRFTPTQMIVQAQGTSVPFKKLMQKAGSATGLSFKDILAQPGSKLVVQNILIDAPAFGLNGTADLIGTPAAPLGATGTMKVNVRGLQDLLAWLNDPNGAAASGIPPLPKELVPALAVAQMVGKPGTDAQGRNNFSYDLVLAADGSIMMNGTPFLPPSSQKP